MGNVEVAWEDVISVLQLVRPHLIVIAVALICMIAAMIIAGKLARPARGFARVQSLLAFLVVTVLVINVMLTGEHPSRTLAKGHLGRVIQRCTMISPQRRYPNILRLIEEL